MRKKEGNYVIGLITGRFKTVKVNDRTQEVFEPNKLNPHPPLRSLLSDENVDVDAVMVQERLRTPKVQERMSYFKNRKERRYLKWLKAQNKVLVVRAGFDPRKRLNPSEPAMLTNRI